MILGDLRNKEVALGGIFARMLSPGRISHPAKNVSTP